MERVGEWRAKGWREGATGSELCSTPQAYSVALRRPALDTSLSPSPTASGRHGPKRKNWRRKAESSSAEHVEMKLPPAVRPARRLRYKTQLFPGSLAHRQNLTDTPEW